MAVRPFRDASGQTAAVYWRRRGVAFLASLAVLAALTWAGAWGSGSLLRADRAAGRRDQSAALIPHYGRAGLSARLTGRAQLGVPEATGAMRAVSAGGTAARGSLKACPAGDVVATMFVSASAYSVRQLAEFDVDLVSTADYSCTFDVGARHVVLDISAGGAAIWTSADCAEGRAVQLTTLRRGVPAVVAMTWNDQYSSAGCPIPGRIAPAGVYTARATVGSVASNSVTFRVG